VLPFEEQATNQRFNNSIFEACRQLLKIDRNEFKIKHVNYMFFNYLMLYYFNILFCDFDILNDDGKINSLSQLTLEFQVSFQYYLLETCLKIFGPNTIILKYDSLNKVSKLINEINPREGHIFKNINYISNKLILVDNTYIGCLYNHAIITKNVLNMEINFLKYCTNENEMLNYREVVYHPVYYEDPARMHYAQGICYNIANGGNNGYDIITPNIMNKGIEGLGTFKLNLDPLFNNAFFDLRNYPNLFFLRSRFVKKNLEILHNETATNKVIICNRSFKYADFGDEDRLVQILLPQTYDTLIKFRQNFEQKNNYKFPNEFNDKHLFNKYCLESYGRVIKLFINQFDSFRFQKKDYEDDFLNTIHNQPSKISQEFIAKTRGCEYYRFTIERKGTQLKYGTTEIKSFNDIIRFNIIFNFYYEHSTEPFFKFKFQHHAKDTK